MHHIKSIQIDKKGTTALFLVSEGGHDFWSDWAKKKATRSLAAKFGSIIFRIQEKGTRWAVQSNKLRVLNGNIGVAEIKGFEGVWRVLCYIEDSDLSNAVMLKAFRGHQGSDQIPPEIIRQGNRLAGIAKEILKEEISNGSLI